MPCLRQGLGGEVFYQPLGNRELMSHVSAGPLNSESLRHRVFYEPNRAPTTAAEPPLSCQMCPALFLLMLFAAWGSALEGKEDVKEGDPISFDNID